MLMFVAATGDTPIGGHFTWNLEPDPGSLPRAKTSSDYRSQADHQPLTETLRLSCLPLLCVTQTLLCPVWTLPSHETIRELSQQV